MREYITLKSLIVRKDNVIFANKEGKNGISVAIDTKNTFLPTQTIQFTTEEERDKIFTKLIVALTGDIE